MKWISGINFGVKHKLGPKASCSWGKGKYYKLFTYKGVIQNGIFAHNGMPFRPYMRIKSVNFDRTTRHATATTVNERRMLCAYFIYIKTNING